MLSRTPEKLKKIISEIDPQIVSEPLDDGKRSIIETVIHQINCLEVTNLHIYLTLFNNVVTIQNIHPERDLGNRKSFDGFTIEEIVTYFSIKIKQRCNLLGTCKEDDWHRTYRIEGNKKPIQLYGLLRGQAIHNDEHLQIMEKRLMVLEK